MSRRAVHTGFGDHPNTSVKFGIRRGRGGEAIDWTGGQRPLTQHRLLGTSRLHTERGQRAPYTVTWRVWLASAAELEALVALQGEVATLWYPWGAGTRRLDGVLEPLAGVDYLRLDGVRLLAVEDVQVEDGDTRQVECIVTFQKEVTS